MKRVRKLKKNKDFQKAGFPHVLMFINLRKGLYVPLWFGGCFGGCFYIIFAGKRIVFTYKNPNLTHLDSELFETFMYFFYFEHKENLDAHVQYLSKRKDVSD